MDKAGFDTRQCSRKPPWARTTATTINMTNIHNIPKSMRLTKTWLARLQKSEHSDLICCPTNGKASRPIQLGMHTDNDKATITRHIVIKTKPTQKNFKVFSAMVWIRLSHGVFPKSDSILESDTNEVGDCLIGRLRQTNFYIQPLHINSRS